MPCCKGKGLSWGQILLQPLASCAWLCREYPTTHSGLPFPGTPWNSPKLLPEGEQELLSDSAGGTGRTPMGGHSRMVLPRKEGAGIPPGARLQVNSSHIQSTLGVCCSHTGQNNPGCKDSSFAS